MSFKFHPYEIRIYIIDYKKKESRRHSSDRKKSVTIAPNETVASANLTKRQKAALEKLEQMSIKVRNQSQKEIIKAAAVATALRTKAVSETAVSDEGIPADSPAIDLENEPIHKKRERQRSLVLNLGK